MAESKLERESKLEQRRGYRRGGNQKSRFDWRPGFHGMKFRKKKVMFLFKGGIVEYASSDQENRIHLDGCRWKDSMHQA